MKTSPFPLILSLLLLSSIPALAAEAKPAAAVLDVANLAIPETLGKIEERFQGDSERWVINIQDVHAHFGAQENIAAILEHLNETYGLRLVAYEGGWSNTSFPKIWEHPSSRDKQLILRTLLEEDVITGAAFAAMTSKMPITLHGVEDENLYKKNLRVYLKFLKQKDQAEEKIKAFEITLSEEKKGLYNPELLRFDAHLLKFREDPKAAASFFPVLLRRAQDLKLNLDEVPQLHLFHEITSLEKSIDKKKLKSESERLMQEHKNSRLSFEEMLRHGTFTEEKLSFYPNTEKHKKLLKLQDGIVHDQLFEEIEKAVIDIKEKLFQNETEKKLDARFGRFVAAKKLMLFKATPADLKAYARDKTQTQEEMASAGLAAELKLGAAFYRLAQKRDHVFFKKISTDPDLIKEDVALVAGGFHTDGIREQLRKAGISYLVITPSLGDGVPDEALYFKRLQGLKALSQTLSELGNRYGNESFEPIILQAIKDAESGNQPPLDRLPDFVLGSTSIETKPQAQLDFMTLSTEVQRLAVEKAVDSLLTGEQPVSLVIRAEALTKILAESPVAARLFKLAMDNSNNQIAVLYKNFSDVPDLVSDEFKPNVKTVGDNDLSRVVNRELQKAGRAAKSAGAANLAVIADDYEKKGVLVLKEKAVALLLFRPLVEQGWNFAWDNPETQSVIAKFAEDVLTAKGYLVSA